MATRILIICKAHEVPGPDKDKAILQANKACQKLWARDFDAQNDRLTIEGEFSYGVRCCLLIDNGPLDSKDYNISFLKWNREDLIIMHGPLPPYILKELRERFQFNPANRPKPTVYTDEEYEQTFGLEKYEELKRARQNRKEIVDRFSSRSLDPSTTG